MGEAQSTPPHALFSCSIDSVGGTSVTLLEGAQAAAAAPRLKAIRHPNILSVLSAREGRLVGLPPCRPLSGASGLSFSEAAYGLRGVALALHTCAAAGMHFSAIAAEDIGIAQASASCHAVHAHRWVIMGIGGADGTSPADTMIAFQRLAAHVFSTLTEEQRVAAASCGVDGTANVFAGLPAEGYFEHAAALVAGWADPLIDAFGLGQELPLLFAADADASQGTAMAGAYEAILEDLRELRRRGQGAVARRCLYPWLVAPEHLAHAASAPLFTDIFDDPVPGSLDALLAACIASSDPALATRFHAHASQLATALTNEQLFLAATGVCFTIHFTASGIAAGWVTAAQVRYCRAAVRAAEHFVFELQRRKGHLPGIQCELPHLIACCGAACEDAAPHGGELSRLLRDALVSACALARVWPAECGSAITMSMFSWGIHLREIAITAVVGALGAALPLEHCGFLAPALVSLCAVEEPSVRHAACSGLLALKAALPLVGMSQVARLISPGLPEPTPRPEATVIGAFAATEAKRTSGPLGSLLTSLAKERAKAAQSTSKAFAVFRTAADRPAFNALLPHSAF